MMRCLGPVVHEADARCVPVADPEVLFAVVIPVDCGDGAAVVHQVKAAGSGDVREFAVTTSKKCAVALRSGVGSAFFQQSVESPPSLSIGEH